MTTGIPLGQRVLGSQLMSGEVGVRRGACGGWSSTLALAAETFAFADVTGLSATTLGTSPSPFASSGTTAPLGACTAEALSTSEE